MLVYCWLESPQHRLALFLFAGALAGSEKQHSERDCLSCVIEPSCQQHDRLICKQFPALVPPSIPSKWQDSTRAEELRRLRGDALPSALGLVGLKFALLLDKLLASHVMVL